MLGLLPGGPITFSFVLICRRTSLVASPVESTGLTISFRIMTEKSVHANPNKNRTPRHRAREFALQGLYQWLLSNEDTGVIDAHIREAHGFNKADAAHFDALLSGTINDVAALRAGLTPLI